MQYTTRSNLAIFRELLIFVALFFFKWVYTSWTCCSSRNSSAASPDDMRTPTWCYSSTYFQWNNAAEIHWFNDVNVKVAGKIPNWRCWCEIHLYNDPAIINGGFSSQLCLITTSVDLKQWMKLSARSGLRSVGSGVDSPGFSETQQWTNIAHMLHGNKTTYIYLIFMAQMAQSCPVM